ncbi:gluconokinase [Rubrobacter aplysinae]|uniref:gluconokinase n=1 Tax=Rubrobacter aplysinae TaxID=909625 RepID=UPI00064BE91C|nr:FGGY family carbohydrate kinase [Rubrobacter aplysinae]
MFVGVDLGTTSAKVVAYDTKGGVLAESEREYPLRSPLPDRAEQDPEEILDAALSSLSEVVQALAETDRQVSGVAFSAAMHSLIALDKDGSPLTAALTYADNRATDQAARIRAEMDGLSVHRRTGTPVHPMSPLAKLLWFREEDPDTFEAAARWVSVKEYIFYRLFGEFLVDYSIASATGLFNLEALGWDEGALGIAGVPEEKLSRPVPTTHAVRGLDETYARRLGLDAGTPFILGANDGVLANLGLGAIEPGVVAMSIGTSGAVRTAVPSPAVDEEGRTFCYALTESVWVIGGPINNGGIALRWLRDEVFPELRDAAEAEDRDPYDLMGELAAGVEAGSGGLVFLPYLMGERAPHWNPEVKGVFFGLTLRHGREHMIRAVLEGVMYQMHGVARSLEEVAGKPDRVRATGGFARSSLWRQITADVFGREISFPESYQSSCLGAAILCMKALGEIDSLEEATKMVGTGDRQQPDEQNARVYRELVKTFDRLYERLEPEFSESPESPESGAGE